MASFTPNFTNLALFRGSWRQKIVGLFFLCLAFFGGGWNMLSDWCFGFFKYLAEECY